MRQEVYSMNYIWENIINEANDAQESLEFRPKKLITVNERKKAKLSAKQIKQKHTKYAKKERYLNKTEYVEEKI